MRLYEFSPLFAALAAQATEDGELPHDVATQIDALEMSLAEKIDNLCRLIRAIEGQALIRKSEADRLTMAMTRDKIKVERLKDYMAYHLSKLERPSLNTGLFRVSVVPNSQPSVEFTGDAAELPDEFRKDKAEPNKQAAAKAHAEGRQIPEGFSIERHSHVRIS